MCLPKLRSCFYVFRTKKIVTIVVVFAVGSLLAYLIQDNSHESRDRRATSDLKANTFNSSMFLYAVDTRSGDVLDSPGVIGFSVGEDETIFRFNDNENLKMGESDFYHVGTILSAPFSAKRWEDVPGAEEIPMEFWGEYEGPIKKYLSLLATHSATIYFAPSGYERATLRIDSDGGFVFSGSNDFYNMNDGKIIVGSLKDGSEIETIIVPLVSN